MNLYELLQLFIIAHWWLNVRLECMGIFFLITKELVIIYSLTGHVEVVRFPDHVLRSRGSQEKRWQAGVASYGRHKKLLVQQDSRRV